MFVTPEDFGACGDDPGDGTGTDDRLAFQTAINSNRRIFLPYNKTYRIGGTLYIPRFQQIIGFGSRCATSHFTGIDSGCARLVFTGSGQACFKNYNENEMLSHGGISGFCVRSIGSYSVIMYFRDMLQFNLSNLGLETTNLNTQGIISRKMISTNESWTNTISDVGVRLPDLSNGYTLDIDWSDSIVSNSQFTGGFGVLERGVGTRFIGNQIERSRYVGLTMLKDFETKNTILTGNSFDLNATHGVLLNAGNITSNGTFKSIITSNNFRTASATTGASGSSSIGLINQTGIPYHAGVIANNIELMSNVQPFAKIGSWINPGVI